MEKTPYKSLLKLVILNVLMVIMRKGAQQRFYGQTFDVIFYQTALKCLNLVSHPKGINKFSELGISHY